MIFYAGQETISINIQQVLVAGWTARNEETVRHHIEELQVLGVNPPSVTPLFYHINKNLLTQLQSIDVLGQGSSGEVEPLIIKSGGQYWLGLGSDHTDRNLETYSVAHSKQVCLKPIASKLWDFQQVSNHLDQLILRSQIDEGNGWVTYQEGSLSLIRPLEELIALAHLPDNTAMLCGTLPAIDGIRPANYFSMEIEDPVLKRKIKHTYKINTLSIVE